MSQLEPQVQALLDREAIRDIVSRYAHLVWQNRAAETVELFTENGGVDLGPDGGVIQGREALREAYGHIRDDQVLHPFVHNHVIELQGDSATGNAYIDLRCIRDGQSLMGSGYYEDQYAKEDGLWKFRFRKIIMHYLAEPSKGWSTPYQGR